MKRQIIDIVLTLLFISTSFTVYSQVKDSQDDDRTIKIPVVFHVIYSGKIYESNDKSPHTTDNISDQFIKNELNDLNLAFLAKNDMSEIDSTFKSIVGNPNIEFQLADTVFQQDGHKGVIRVFSPENNKDLVSKSKLIDTENYLNVYIGNDGNATNIDGKMVKLNFRDIGLGTHVLTHETGHWLGLYHIWGKTGSCNRFIALFKRDDGIDDTPPQKKCSDLSRTSCPPKNRAVKKGAKSNYNNFMDYSACRCMFTEKQAIKMRNNIIIKRPNLF
tara:strand:+ start:3900 stop:4721 length:822 start_codon:yes stop_codon:yes gene_type:complete